MLINSITIQKMIDNIRQSKLAIIIGLIALLLYLPTLSFDFVGLDDSLLIYKNSLVQEFSFRTITQVFRQYDPELYIPLTFLSYQINHLVSGVEPWIYHATNAILHAISAMLVFGIAKRLSKNTSIGFLTGLLFAIHPLNTEAVAWASARKDVLSGVFFFASILFYLKYRDGKENAYWKSIILFLLALLSKVTVLLLPVGLLLIDWYNKRSGWKEAIKEKIPYFILSIIFGMVALFGKSQNISTLNIFEQKLLMIKSAAFALQKIVWPTELRVFYQQYTPISLSSAEFIVPTLVILMTAMILFLLRRNRSIIFGFAFTFLMLAPIFATFTKGHSNFFFSDRYIYLALPGVFFAISTIFYKYIPHKIRNILIIIVTIPFIYLSFIQEKTWKTSNALYENVLLFEPNSAIALQNLGAAKKFEYPEKAIELYHKAIEIDPIRFEALINLGEISEENNNVIKAQEYYEAAVETVEKLPILMPNDLLPYYKLGELLEYKGQMQAALEQFERAYERSPDEFDSNFNLGLKLQKIGRTEEAYNHFKKANKIHYYVPALYHFAAVAAETGRLEEAREALNKVVKDQPDYEKARHHLVNIERMLKD